MDSLNGDTELTIIQDLQSDLYNSESNKNPNLTVLFENMEIMEKIIEILEEVFLKISQSNQTVARLENTKHKDSQVIESLALNFGERLEIEDTVELLYEQIETLKQLLYYQELEMQEIRQELHDTNVYLCTALNSPRLTLDEAKEVVKKILVSKKPISETLATLLSSIYNSTVEPVKLEHGEKTNSIQPLISTPANCRLSSNEESQTKIKVVRKQAAEIREKSKMLRQQALEIQAQYGEIQAQYMELGIKFVGSQAAFMASHPNITYRSKLKAIARFD
ncbi:hypothetical protein [Scytonema sp. NUACC26]|uniref:hypothetical protein n=1 Tax=Scytonema sp. NUACC26 TaxID=3140176 RepID=UPI0034DBBB02